jgi:ABC-type polysaccharide/polyol phosphate export permease
VPQNDPVTAVYDSAEARVTWSTPYLNLWRWRGLLRLLAVRDLVSRYRRSVLGVAWTFLVPLMTTAVLWVVFSGFFRFQVPDVPFIVYLLSGILVVTFVQQGILGVGNSLLNHAPLLTRVYVPPEVMAAAHAASIGVNLCVSLVPLLVIQLVLGVGVPPTVLLLPLLVALMFAFVLGIGLFLAVVAIRFRDVLDLAGVSLVLLAYATPTFYPLEIVPEAYRPLLALNPAFWYLDVFRNLVYGGTLGSPQAWLVCVACATFSLLLGTRLFSALWPRSVTSL